jgi:hypothetical protein
MQTRERGRGPLLPNLLHLPEASWATGRAGSLSLPRQKLAWTSVLLGVGFDHSPSQGLLGPGDLLRAVLGARCWGPLYFVLPSLRSGTCLHPQL